VDKDLVSKEKSPSLGHSLNDWIPELCGIETSNKAGLSENAAKSSSSSMDTTES